MRSVRCLLCLFLALMFITVAPAAEAVKIILEKTMAFTDEGEPDGFEEISRRTLEALHFETIAVYGYYLAGEVAESDLASFQRTAASLELMYEIRRDFDLIQINGYSFSSFGQPAGLPESLTITEYEGDIGMYLVQFKAPMTPTWWRALKAAGEVVAYYPQNTYLVRADKADLPVLRLVNGVQHVSLFQPAYKVRGSLGTQDEVVEVDVEFDGDQDLEVVRTAIRGLLNEDLRTDRIGRFAYSRLRAALAKRTLILRRPEVTWVEPALQIEFGGERTACVTAGKHDGEKPVRNQGQVGYKQWLLDKGFCVPSVDLDGNCLAYWAKVAVIDSGLDKMICTDTGYERDPATGKPTGVCNDYLRFVLHHDLNHGANHNDNCSGGSRGGLTLDPEPDCHLPVITELYFCSGDDVGGGTRNHCFDTEYSEYHFSDTFDDYDGHGTAVASIIVGDPWSYDSSASDIHPLDPDPEKRALLVDPEGFYRGIGVAPSARIIVGRIGDQRASSSGDSGEVTHLDFKQLIAETRQQGARFANNSWNLSGGYTDPPGPTVNQYGYTSFSKIADFLVRHGDGWGGGHQNEMTIVFSAGNWNGLVGTASFVTSPANAKNVITVGAARGWAHHPDSAMAGTTEENCAFEDEENAYVIRDIAGFSFGGDDVGWHSRRGFAHELGTGNQLPRYKPDLVAPGTHGSSAHSSVVTNPPFYRCFGGTSAAAPTVTASAVLAEAWFWHMIGSSPSKPSPAMIKAMLVASADSLKNRDYPYVAGTDHLDGSLLEYAPSLPQGWGRVNLDNLFQTEEPIRDVVVYDQDHRLYPLDQSDPEPERRFTPTVQSWQVALKVDDASENVVIVMVYTDRFAQPGVQSLTVNDLNLRVNQLGANSGGSRTYWGNYFDTDGYSKNTTGPMSSTPYDHVNTVEMIRIEAGELQSWPFRVTVTGAQISMNAVPGLDNNDPNQDFALYVYNAKLASAE